MKIALDWTPNPVHCGTFTALSKGWFAKEGIDLQLHSPASDQYSITPAEQLRLGVAHLSIVPPEEIIKDQLGNKNQLVPLRAILQHNPTSIAVAANSGITRPAHLDGKKYALLNLPWEKEIITAMVKNDGGQGEIEWVEAPKLEIYELFFAGHIDFAWIFNPIEGIEAQLQGMQLRSFKLEDYGIPYGCTTILAASVNAYELNKEEIDLTLSIIEAGYSLAHIDAELAAKAIFNHPLNTYYKDYSLLHQCQKAITPYLADKGDWGYYNVAKMENFKKWIQRNCIQ